MSIHRIILCLSTVLSLFILGGVALGQDVKFEIARLYGLGNGKQCTRENVQTVSAGSNVSLVFDDVGIESQGMPPRKRQRVSTRCLIYGWLTVPKGYYMDSYGINLNYGIVKSKGISAFLWSSFYFLSFNSRHDHIFLHQNHAVRESVNEPLLVLEEKRKLSRSLRRSMCKRTEKADYRMLVGIDTATSAHYQRARSGDVIIGLDSSDYNFEMETNIKPCQQLTSN